MTTAKEELARLLTKHQFNLNKLQERVARYGAGEAPLFLLNQIEEEKQAVIEIKEQLSGTRDEPSLAEQYFSKGTRSLILGDLWEAKRHFQIVLERDPFYPRTQELLDRVEKEIQKVQRAQPSRQWYRYGTTIGLILLIILPISVILYFRHSQRALIAQSQTVTAEAVATMQAQLESTATAAAIVEVTTTAAAAIVEITMTAQAGLTATPEAVVQLECYPNCSGVNLNSAALQGASLSDVDLQGANLNSADLQGAELSSANLRGADLKGANLDGANLQGSDLSEADVSGANLRGIDLSGANLTGADLRQANLREANLNGANLSRADLSEANLSGANLSDANLSDTNLTGANLTGANLTRAILSETD